MKTRAIKGAASLLTLVLLVGGLLAIGFPGGAATTKQVDQGCITDANGNFSCNVKIPKDAIPGEYTLRATGEGRAPTGAATPYPPQEGALTVSNNRLCPGQETLTSGTGFIPFSIVAISLERIGPLTFGGLGLSGVAEAQTIRNLTAKVTVVDCDPKVNSAAANTTNNSSTSGKKLSQTGINALRLLAIAGAALGIGFAFVTVGRRKIRRAGANS